MKLKARNARQGYQKEAQITNQRVEQVCDPQEASLAWAHRPKLEKSQQKQIDQEQQSTATANGEDKDKGGEELTEGHDQYHPGKRRAEGRLPALDWRTHVTLT